MKVYRKAIIVADDLTGACDTAGQFSRLGYRVAVTIDPGRLRDLVRHNDVLAISTNTRGEEPGRAYEVVREAVNAAITAIKDMGLPPADVLWYKKIDSTLRGNVVEESIAMYEALNAGSMIFAPAYPKHGRVTIDGVHLVKGVPVIQTYFGMDARAPARSSNIAEYFKGLPYSYKHISITDLRSKAAGKDLCSYEIVSSDIEVEEDFKILIDIVSTCDIHSIILWVGSAGLAEHLATHITIASHRRAPVLICIGSPNDMVRRQLARLVSEAAPCMVLPDIETLLQSNPSQLYEEALAKLTPCLDKGAQAIIIASAYEERQLEQARLVASALGVSMISIGERIAEGLGRLCALVANAIGLDRVGGIVLSGGDTALSVLKQLGLGTLRVVGEVEPGIPIMEAGAGVKVVTKAGGFGGAYSLLRILYRLGGFRG